MKKLLFTLFILFAARMAFADSMLIEGFEYGNHDGEVPVGWVCDDNSWLAGYLDKDHNRTPHTGNWYAYTNSAESWMFMPMFMSQELKYRFTLWAISDGGYHMEIWAGNEANPTAMTQLLLDETVSGDTYEKFSAYIEEMSSDYEYFGIHAVQSYCGDCILTLDDIRVDMVGKYEVAVEPFSFYTTAEPGSQVEFNCTFLNLGYEPANVIITPHTIYFSDLHMYIDGTEHTQFHAEPNETVDFTGIATLSPDIETGTMAYLDIFFALDCDCATAMFTLWATAGYESVDEHNISTMSIYPNPSNGDITIEGTGTLTITNTLGQKVLERKIIEKETITLEKGIYFVKIGDGLSKKIIVK